MKIPKPLQKAKRKKPTQTKPIAAPILKEVEVQLEALKSAPEPSKVIQIVRVVRERDGDLFHAAGGEEFCTFPPGLTYAIRSDAFKLKLLELWYRHCGESPARQTVDGAVGQLCAHARFDGLQREVFLRVAEADGSLYLDLGDAAGRAIEIGSGTWSILDHAPVRFRRESGMLEIPPPIPGGNLDALWAFIPVADEKLRRLLLVWLVYCLRSRGPFPIIDLAGPEGSGKSTAARVLRTLVDPSEAALRLGLKSVQNLVIAASSSHVLALDNLSGLHPDIADALCCIATGATLAARKLYSDKEESRISVARPIILNGIPELLTRSDLADRTISIVLEPMGAKRRRSEGAFLADFEAARPALLGAILDLAARARARLPQAAAAAGPVGRMADFEECARACFLAQDWPVEEVATSMAANRARADAVVLEACPIVDPLLAIVRSEGGHLEINAAALLNRLTDHHEREHPYSRPLSLPGWPRGPQGLSQMLTRQAPSLLRAVGLTLRHVRAPSKDRTRLISLNLESADRTRPDDSGRGGSVA